jgi:hypothetical protein
MLQAPIDYSIKAEDPAASFGKWYNIGNGIRQNGLAEQQAEQAKIDAAAKAEADTAEQAALNESLSKYFSGNSSPEDLALVVSKMDPQKLKVIQEGFQQLTPDQRQNNALQAAQLKSLLEGGYIEQAKKLMVDQAEAARNSGDEQRAKAIETMFHDVVDSGDVGVKTALLTLGAGLYSSDEGRKTLQAQWDAKKDSREQELQPGELDKQRLENEKRQLDMDLARATAEWKKINATDLSQDQKISAETQMRKNLETLPPVATFMKKTSQYANVLNAGNSAFSTPGMAKDGVKYDGQGVADMNLIYSYIKMLDDGGAVMNGDYVAAEGASGLVQQAANVFNKLANGDKLTPTVRAQYLDEARGIYEASKDLAQKAATTYESIATRSGLDPKNVVALNFATPTRNASEKAGDTKTKQAEAPVPATAPEIIKVTPSTSTTKGLK